MTKVEMTINRLLTSEEVDNIRDEVEETVQRLFANNIGAGSYVVDTQDYQTIVLTVDDPLNNGSLPLKMAMRSMLRSAIKTVDTNIEIVS